MSLYDRLGVAATASADELHQAYRSQANRLHPDKQVGRSAEEQAEAAREMQRLNEAWHVLSDAGRRRQYDASLAPPAAPTSPPGPRPRPDAAADVGASHDPAVATLVRLIPVALLVLGLLAVFAFTAIALSGPDEADDSSATTATSSAASTASVAAGDCILVERGHVRAIVPCEGPHDARVARRIPRAEACPADEQRVDGPEGSSALCVVLSPP